MTTISKSEFNEWRGQIQTKEFFQAVRARLETAVESLKGISVEDLQKTQGYVAALEDILNTEFEDF